MKNQKIRRFFRKLIKPARMQNIDNKFHSRPAKVLEILTYCGFSLVIVRAGFVLISPAKEANLEAIASKQYHRPLELGNYRGTIYDRRGVPLAISTKVPSLAVNPKVFDPDAKETLKLAKILGVNGPKIKEIEQKNTYFAWLGRKLEPQMAEQAHCSCSVPCKGHMVCRHLPENT
jgi:cell division protein FtsI (penicillin-binding protein 3)